MGRKARVGQLEAKIKGPKRREPFDWEAAYGEIGVLTRNCILLYLTSSKTREALEGHVYQLMRVGTFAMDMLTEHRTVSEGERAALRQLMTDPDYRGFGWTEEKHPRALQLYRLCAVRGWL
ncbi:hypothetical protein [Arthrobacter sp. TE12232]